MHRPRLLLLCALLLVPSRPYAAAPVHYRFMFPEPEHHWMQVEATFPELTAAPLELRMSRASPGRYSLHDFAKNVYDVHAFAADGRELPVGRPDPYGWNVSDHGGSVKVTYKIYGDVVDGTYLAVDTSHAHINMPAAVMWARGLDDRPAILTFAPPAGTRWQIATQLHAGPTAFEVTAPNLQYLMDSPVELGPVSIRQFTVGSRTFRVAVHHRGSDGDLVEYVQDLEKIVRQEGAVFGEYPDYEPGHYTFIADYLPYATGDGMEHRNSTVITEAASIGAGRSRLFDTVAHEFFHSWNVERIRPRSIEPFDFERANMSGELWLAEGFAQYYSRVILQRAGLADLPELSRELTEFVEAAAVAPGRAFRSAEEMSRMAPFVDGGAAVDRTNWSNSVTSYYPLGGAIALALDLTLRSRSGAAVTLDDFMRAMWRVHGKPGGAREGYVDRPYTAADAEARLAEVSGDPPFARDFFRRYIQGREAPDFPALLARAGFIVRPRNRGRAWWGDVRLEPRSGRMAIAALVPANSPAYAAGLEQDDVVRQLDGTPLTSFSDLSNVLARHKPGDRLNVAYVDRTGVEKTGVVVLAADPHLEVVPNESEDIAVSPAQRFFRDRWLSPLK